MRTVVSNQEEFNQLVANGGRFVNTDFTFNMGIGLMVDFPSHLTIRFVNCTFYDVVIQFLTQNEVSFTKCTIKELVVCDGGKATLLKLTNTALQSVRFRDGGWADDFRISNSTMPFLFCSVTSSRVLTISKFSRIGRLSLEACQSGLEETISIVNSEIGDLAFEANKISKRLTIKTSQITNTAHIFYTELKDFFIESSTLTSLELREITVSNMMIKKAKLDNGTINGISLI